MKDREYSFTGRTDAKGAFSILALDAFRSFFFKLPKTSFVGRIKVYQPGTTAALRGYYWNKIIPDFQKAIWLKDAERLTERQTELKARSMCPITISEEINEETGKYDQEVRELKDLDKPEMVAFMDWLKDNVSIEYNFFIDDPRTL